MATRKPGTTARPGGGGTKSRDKGTRGGRPEASTTTGQRQGNRPGGGRAGQRAGQRRPGRRHRSRPPPSRRHGPAAPPRGSSSTTWMLSLAGLGVSIYLTIAHYNTAVTLACPATSTINCEKVTTSPESIVFGIPVAVLGLAFYVFLAVVNSPWAWRITWPPLRWARVGSVVVGILFVLYLIYAETVLDPRDLPVVHQRPRDHVRPVRADRVQRRRRVRHRQGTLARLSPPAAARARPVRKCLPPRKRLCSVGLCPRSAAGAVAATITGQASRGREGTGDGREHTGEHGPRRDP